jgi:hypothetical protein
MKGMLKNGARLLIVEPTMHVSREFFSTMCAEAEEAGLKIVGFPKGKGGRSVLFGV